MADLLDIAPSTAVAIVTIDDLRIKVHKIGINDMAAIIAAFPALKSIAAGNDSDLVPRLIAGCGAAIGPIIAAGCGHGGEEAYEQRAAQLLPEQQIKLLRAIFGLTFPNGLSSCVEELAAVAAMIGGTSEGPKTI